MKGLFSFIILRRMSSELSAVFITTNSIESATGLAEGLVKNELAGCVNIIPGVLSIYKWEGEINRDQEFVLMVKTRKVLVEPLTQWVKENHHYKCPEVIALPVFGGNSDYFQFILNSTLNK